MISILIPTFNDDCTALAKALGHQAEAIRGLEWELIVADDASTDASVVEANRAIGLLPHCRVVRRKQNVGRARIRNVLAEEARGEWLLYIDGDGKVVLDDYLRRFLDVIGQFDACYGGYRMMPGPPDNLRWRYERAAAPRHSAGQRARHPYQSFNISNLLIRRELMTAHPLDARFTRYGYEDVLLGKQLQCAGIVMGHIDAPIGFFDYEPNDRFVAKTEEGLRTLHAFRDELRGFSTLLATSERMGAPLRWAFRRMFRLMQKRWRSNLCGTSPSLFLFKCYKLGYFLSLSGGAAAPTD